MWYGPNETVLGPRHASLGMFNIVYIGSRKTYRACWGPLPHFVVNMK